MAQRQRAIALVGSSRGETPRALLAARRQHLSERGWDAHLLWEEAGEGVQALEPLAVDLAHFDCAYGAADPPVAGIRPPECVIASIVTGDLYTADSRYPDEERVLEGCRRADLLHLTDPAVRERTMELGCPAGTPAAVVPPAADPSLLEIDRRESDGSGPLRLISIGPLTWMEGYEHAIHAVRLLLDRGIDCRYRLIGTGTHVDVLLYGREHLGLTDTVEFVDDADDRRRIEELRQADVFLHSAVVPGLTQTVVDAEAAGLEVVATEAGELMREALGEGAGILVPRRDPGAIADAVAEHGRSPKGRLEMGRSARRRATELFDLRDQNKAFERLYSETLAVSEGLSRKSAPKV